MPNKPTVLNSMLLLLVRVVVSKPLEKNLKSLKNLVFTLPTMKKVPFIYYVSIIWDFFDPLPTYICKHILCKY